MGDCTNVNSAYDYNGNILAMTQKGLVSGATQTIDQLSYAYRTGSNKLAKVTENAMDTKTYQLGDFNDGTNTDDDYDYDANGNLTKDQNKNIASISYNILNLPEYIAVTGKGAISYQYDATGNKLQKKVTEGSATKITDYLGGSIFENNVLQHVAMEEGRLRPSGSSFVADYMLKDHLGNVRSLVAEDGTLLEESSYYPFGLTMKGISSEQTASSLHNKKKFNGIEFDEDLEIEAYEAFYRNLDPQTGRWWQIDPKIEGQEDLSPYNAMANDPIKLSDPLGDEPDGDDPPGAGSVTWSFVKGIGQSVWSTVEGAGHAIAHPIETVKGIGTAVAHPIETAKAIGNAVSETYTEFKSGNADVKANILGKVVGEVGQIVVGAEAVKAGTTALRGAKVAEEATVVAKTAETAKGLGNPFKSATLGEVRSSFEKKVTQGTMEKRGPNAYVNKKSGYSYNIDKGGSYGRKGKLVEQPHVDVNYPNPKPKNVLPKKKLNVAGE